ncbi:MAG: ECF transporter S component [Ruminococcaceae bacterium]|nr:ECF transporter S component [Oscillospiraceae bacterium]
MNMSNTHEKTRRLVGLALFSAIVVVLQLLGSFIRFGVFSISLVLVPIVVGAALYGALGGGWLGFVFGMAVLLSGDAGAFLAVNVPGTIITVLVKGTAAGLVAGYAYKLVEKLNQTAAVAVSAVLCPVVNTGIFLIGCLLFFMPTIQSWAGGESVGRYMILGLVGANFLVELAVNVLLCPTIVRLIRIGRKEHV